MTLFSFRADRPIIGRGIGLFTTSSQASRDVLRITQLWFISNHAQTDLQSRVHSGAPPAWEDGDDQSGQSSAFAPSLPQCIHWLSWQAKCSVLVYILAPITCLNTTSMSSDTLNVMKNEDIINLSRQNFDHPWISPTSWQGSWLVLLACWVPISGPPLHWPPSFLPSLPHSLTQSIQDWFSLISPSHRSAHAHIYPTVHPAQIVRQLLS